MIDCKLTKQEFKDIVCRLIDQEYNEDYDLSYHDLLNFNPIKEYDKNLNNLILKGDVSLLESNLKSFKNFDKRTFNEVRIKHYFEIYLINLGLKGLKRKKD